MSYENIDDDNSRRKRERAEANQSAFSNEAFQGRTKEEFAMTEAQRAGIAGGLKYLEDVHSGNVAVGRTPPVPSMRFPQSTTTGTLTGDTMESIIGPDASIGVLFHFFRPLHKVVLAVGMAAKFRPSTQDGTATDGNIYYVMESNPASFTSATGTVNTGISPVQLPVPQVTYYTEDETRPYIEDAGARFTLAVRLGSLERWTRHRSGPLPPGTWGIAQQINGRIISGTELETNFWFASTAGMFVVPDRLGQRLDFKRNTIDLLAGNVIQKAGSAELDPDVRLVPQPRLIVLGAHPTRAAEADAAFGDFNGAVGYSRNSNLAGGKLWVKFGAEWRSFDFND